MGTIQPRRNERALEMIFPRVIALPQVRYSGEPPERMRVEIYETSSTACETGLLASGK